MFRTERLRDSHNLDLISCENGLDEWLQTSALRADRGGTARTYVLIGDSNEVDAYFTILPHHVHRLELPKPFADGPEFMPGFLIAKLARHERLRGEGVGDIVLNEALHYALEAIRVGGGRLIVVDAVNEQAYNWYQRKGFTPIGPVGPTSMRLVMKASRAARTAEASRP